MAKETNNNEILAELKGLNKRFDKMDERFGKMDERFDKMDERFDKMDERFGKMDERFDKMDERFGKMDERFDKMDERFDKNDERFGELEKTVNEDIIGVLKTFSNEVDERFTRLEKTVTKMNSQMVTKDYLDEKLYDLRGDLVLLTRKEDVKLNELVKILRDKNVLDEIEERKPLAMEPFAKLSL